MRILSALTGIAVLFTTLAFAHLMHHHFMGATSADHQSPAFLAGFGLAVVVEILSFIGGCLLIRRSR
jgi:hypothetical protein